MADIVTLRRNLGHELRVYAKVLKRSTQSLPELSPEVGDLVNELNEMHQDLTNKLSRRAPPPPM
jgi:hypothetical protein